MLSYSHSVFKSLLQKSFDGTIDAVSLFSRSGRKLEAYLEPTEGGFIRVSAGDIYTKTIEEYRQIVNDDTEYQKLEVEKFRPCFHRPPDLHPFQNEGLHDDLFSDESDGPMDSSAFKEGFLSPAYTMRHHLAEIAHRFPGGDEHTLGDKDVRDRLSALSYCFHHNYKRLGEIRLTAVMVGMAAVVGVTATACAMIIWMATQGGGDFLRGLAGNVRGIPGLDRLGIGVPLILTCAGDLAVVSMTAIFWFLISAGVQHVLDMAQIRFQVATGPSAARVMKAVTSRQDNLNYLERSMIEEIDRTREAAWAQKALDRWVVMAKRWVTTVFWTHERIAAIEEHLSINMKIIGLHYSGLRAEVRFRALRTSGVFYFLNVFILLLVWLVAFFMGLHATESRWSLAFEAVVASFLVFACGFLIHFLHKRVKALEEMQSINIIINQAATAYMKGYRDSALHEVIATYMEREKQKMLITEEMLRGK